MATDVPVTFRSIVAAFTDFLTVAIHTILYERGIYPQTSFLTTRKYNYTVRQNRHPQVCEWINDAVAAVETQLLKCTVDRIAVVIYNKTNEPLERFMFDTAAFPVVPEMEIDVPLQRGGTNENDTGIQALPVVDMDEQFRAIMSRLANCAASLQPVPKACTFTVAIELRGNEHNAPLSHPQAWIPVVPARGSTTPSSSSSSARATSRASKATPVRAMCAGELVFDAWIEESFVKLQSDTPSSGNSQSDTSLR